MSLKINTETGEIFLDDTKIGTEAVLDLSKGTVFYKTLSGESGQINFITEKAKK